MSVKSQLPTLMLDSQDAGVIEKVYRVVDTYSWRKRLAAWVFWKTPLRRWSKRYASDPYTNYVIITSPLKGAMKNLQREEAEYAKRRKQRAPNQGAPRK